VKGARGGWGRGKTSVRGRRDGAVAKFRLARTAARGGRSQLRAAGHAPAAIPAPARCPREALPPVSAAEAAPIGTRQSYKRGAERDNVVGSSVDGDCGVRAALDVTAEEG
jgi:hypothetical protein